MQPSESFLMRWKFEKKYQDELLIPKIALAEQDIQDLIDEQGSKLLLKSVGKNSCVDFDNSKNGQWVSFPYSGSLQQSELNQLVSVVRSKVKQYPSTSLQVKRAVRWNNDFKNILSYGFLYIGHLNDSDKARVANFLTGCNIDFFFSRTNVLVLQLEGLDDNILLRLAQYAEVPLPSCLAQGGFQLTFRPSRFGLTVWTTVSVGRIGSYSYIPAQLSLESIYSDAGVEHLRWIVSMLEERVQATAIQKVFCTSEMQDGFACLQFLVPVSFERQLPLRWRLEDKQYCVDHPVPFAMPIGVGRRPPEEQSKVEHWKETANKSFTYRKGRQNSLAHHPKLVDSMCRFSLLQHGEILSDGKRFSALYENNFLPFLFVNGRPKFEDVLDFCEDCFVDNSHVGSSMGALANSQQNCGSADIYCEVPTLYCLEVLQDKQEPLKIGRFLFSKGQFFASTTESLLCHAFSPCTVVLVVPKGSTIDQVCGPRDSYDTIGRIPLKNESKPKMKDVYAGPINSSEGHGTGVGGDNQCPTPTCSYVDARNCGKGIQSPPVAISPTLPWTCMDDGRDRQLPKPATVAMKQACDQNRQDTFDDISAKPIAVGRDLNGKEPEDVEMATQEVTTALVTAKLVTSQASPLRGSAASAEHDSVGLHIRSPKKNNPSCPPSKEKENCQPGNDQRKKALVSDLKSPLPPGKPVKADVPPSKNQTVRSRANSAPPKSSALRLSKAMPTRDTNALATAFRNAQASVVSSHVSLQPKCDGKDAGAFDRTMIDLTENCKESRTDEVDTSLQEQVADALEKWYPGLDKQSKREDMVSATAFLRYMNSTLCFLTVSFRMLSKAPWKSKMLTAHVRQAALAAIGNAWYVWTNKQHKLPFTRAELALAAVSYRGSLEPRMPDDPAQAIFPMVDCLPTGIGCEEMFSQGMCFCPFCGSQRIFAVPTFATAVTWKSPSWTSLLEALSGAEAFPWKTRDAWHSPGCTRDEVTVKVNKFGPWVLLLFRPRDSALYPSLQEIAVPLSDASIADQGLCVSGLLCTDIGGEHGRHFWFVEPTDGRAAKIYDSLKGEQSLTTELARRLHTVGILLLPIESDNPILTNTKLDLASGKVLPFQKSEKPIRVAARSKRKSAHRFRHRQDKKKCTKKPKELGAQGHAKGKRTGLTNCKGSLAANSPKRPISMARSASFQRRCTEDPDDPISDGEFGPRPNKQCRSTPEKVLPSESRNHSALGQNLDRAGKASPSAIRMNVQEGTSFIPEVEGQTVTEATGGQSYLRGEDKREPFPVGDHGVISLFDGVSSVVPTLCQKLRLAPKVVILAEMDQSLRELVAFEFGYCLQERWKASFAGTPTIYVKDVRRVLEKGCLILLQAHQIAPTAFMVCSG